MSTLVIDTGQDIVGIFCIDDKNFIPYRGDAIPTGINRIQAADEIVTYNGKLRDLEDLGKFSGLSGELPLKGRHTDMRSICWSDRILGSSLDNTYFQHFTDCPVFQNSHEGSCERDVY